MSRSLQTGMLLAAACLALGASGMAPASAQDRLTVPRAYMVSRGGDAAAAETGIPVLAKPKRRAREIGALAPGSGPVEVLETDETHRWGRIVWREASGWVALRDLAPVEVPALAGSSIPVGLLCLGSEPFWDLRIVSETEMRLRQLDGVTVMAAIGGAAASRNRDGFPAMTWGTGGGLTARLILRPGACSDTVSDRIYGWIGDVVVVAQNGQFLLSGCCYLPLEN